MKITQNYWVFVPCPSSGILQSHNQSFFNSNSGRGGLGVESNWVHSALRPPVGLMCQPRVIMVMDKLVE
jgi:hypothetical protein